jgi:uncharacterized membrane protein
VVVAIATVFLVLALVVLLVALVPSWFGLAGSGSPGRSGPFGGAFLLLFLLILAFFVLRVAFWGSRAAGYRSGAGGGYGRGYGADRPAMVARMRYARGEITKEQFDQILQDLQRPPGSP